jgi:ABC-type Fe3+/spermidine/putrescine transport system ATPase subunit
MEDVRKTYGANHVLRDLTLEVEPGEFFTLLGPSGSGKSTALKIVAGFIEPTAGRVAIGGRDVTRLPPRERRVGMVFQSYALFPHLTVFENVAFGLRERRRPEGEVRASVASLLQTVGLSDFAARYPRQLSGGQQQRVALARALAVEPQVVLLDEPLAALDAKLRETLQEELKRLQSRLGATMIYVTHDQREAFTLSDRIAVLRDGRLCQVGPPDEIYERPASVFVAGFVGRANRIDLAAAGVEIRGEGTGEVAVVRPERCRLGGPGENRLPGRFVGERFLGDATVCSVDVGAGEWQVALRGTRSGLAPGAPVEVVWDPGDTRLLPAEP